MVKLVRVHIVSVRAAHIVGKYKHQERIEAIYLVEYKNRITLYGGHRKPYGFCTQLTIYFIGVGS